MLRQGRALCLAPLLLHLGAVGGESVPAAVAAAPATVSEVEIRVDLAASLGTISPFLASANCHGLQRHCLDHPEWDRLMREFFGGNLLVLLERARREPDEKGAWWDVAACDEFISRARERWQTRDLMFLPQWWLAGWDGASPPTEEQLELGTAVLLQLVRRYGLPEEAPPVTYWVMLDEWSNGKYWQAHPEEFARVYTRLVRAVKSVNPALRVGGPVDAWPNREIITALLEACPDLDFVAWNLFVTGSATTPDADVFRRTEALGRNVRMCRELSREIRGIELPVICTSYNLNHHAWDPPDLRLAEPLGGVWNALALTTFAQAGCESAVIYNVLALDCGLFGPRDGFAEKAGLLAGPPAGGGMHVRPLARVHRFFKQYVAGASRCSATVTGDAPDLSVLAATRPDGQSVLVVVNAGEEHRRVRLLLEPSPFADKARSGRPSSYLYCDPHGMREGRGQMFRVDGTGVLPMPSYSAWCLVL